MQPLLLVLGYETAGDHMVHKYSCGYLFEVFFEKLLIWGLMKTNLFILLKNGELGTILDFTHTQKIYSGDEIEWELLQTLNLFSS